MFTGGADPEIAPGEQRSLTKVPLPGIRLAKPSFLISPSAFLAVIRLALVFFRQQIFRWRHILESAGHDTLQQEKHTAARYAEVKCVSLDAPS